MTPDERQVHLFEYSYNGAQYGFEIPAESQDEAIKRLNAMYYAKYLGVLHVTIPANSIVGGFVPRLYCFIRNVINKIHAR